MNTSHIPVPAARQRAYSGQARSYDRDTGVFQPCRRQLVEALPLDRGQVVLDVGCGTGLCCGLLRDKVGPRGGVVGIEESPQMAAVACERIALEGWRNVSVVQSPAEDARITPAADAALCCAVHDILQSPGALRNVLARLRPGGMGGRRRRQMGRAGADGDEPSYQHAARSVRGQLQRILPALASPGAAGRGRPGPGDGLRQRVHHDRPRAWPGPAGHGNPDRCRAGRFPGPLATGGLIHVPGHLPARHRGHRGQHRDPPRPVNKLSTAGPAAAYPPVVTDPDLPRHRGRYAHLNLSSTQPRCLSGGKPVTGQAGGCHGLIHPPAG